MPQAWRHITRTCLVAAAAVAVLLGCEKKLDRSSPEATIATARQLVEEGDARRLADLIYADTPQMRQVYSDLGVVMGHLQELGLAIRDAFPKEVEAMQARAEAAAKSGQATSLLAQIAPQRRSFSIGAGRRAAQTRSQREEALNDAIARLFADPYGWIKESEARLSTTFLTDDTVALLWDNKPILPPIGMVMRRDYDGQWYFALPTNLPGVSNFLPRTDEQLMLWGSLIATLDQVVVDLTNDVRKGHVLSLEDVARKAGEKAFVPAAMAFFALAKYEELKRKEAREAQKAADAQKVEAQKAEAPAPEAAPTGG